MESSGLVMLRLVVNNGFDDTCSRSSSVNLTDPQQRTWCPTGRKILIMTSN